MIKLGQRVRDRISGLEGIVIGRMEYLYGCTRIAVQPQDVKDGKPVESTFVDEPQLELLGDEFVADAEMSRPPEGAVPATGRHGDREDPPSRMAPSR